MISCLDTVGWEEDPWYFEDEDEGEIEVVATLHVVKSYAAESVLIPRGTSEI